MMDIIHIHKVLHVYVHISVIFTCLSFSITIAATVTVRIFSVSTSTITKDTIHYVVHSGTAAQQHPNQLSLSGFTVSATSMSTCSEAACVGKLQQLRQAQPGRQK